jgi:hypothetical protein
MWLTKPYVLDFCRARLARSALDGPRSHSRKANSMKRGT